MATNKQRYISQYLSTHPGKTEGQAAYQWRLFSHASLPKGEARGHGVHGAPEHGGVLKGVPRDWHGAGRTIHSRYSDKAVEALVNKAASNDSRVIIKVHSRFGGWKTAGGTRGYSAGYVAKMQAQAGGIRAAVDQVFGDVTGDGYDLPEGDDIDAWQIDELET